MSAVIGLWLVRALCAANDSNELVTLLQCETKRHGAARAPRGRRHEIAPGEDSRPHTWGFKPAKISCAS